MTEPLGDPGFDQLDDTGDGDLRILHLHEIEVALGFGRIEIGNRALVDAMSAGDDATLGGLPEHPMSPTIKRAAPSGTALISVMSTMEISSITNRSQSSGLSSPRLKAALTRLLEKEADRSATAIQKE